MTGVGGGSLMTPLLILLFGIHPATAVGTDLLYAAATKTGGTLVHGYNRTVDWRIVGAARLGQRAGHGGDAVRPLASRTHAPAGGQRSHHPGAGLRAVLHRSRADLPRATRGILRRACAANSIRGAPQSLTVATGAVLGVLVSISSVGAGAHRRDSLGAALSPAAHRAHRRLRHRPCRAVDACWPGSAIG